jgi:very-short-patch-repair endonuclease
MVKNWNKYKDKKYYDHLCICGRRIKVKPHHKYHGIPKSCPEHGRKGKYQYPRETRVCALPSCNTTFECREDSSRKYCSKKCANRCNSKSRKHGRWNFGLTKETDKRVAKQAKKLRGRRNGPPSKRTRKKIGRANSIAMKKNWQDPEYRNSRKHIKHSTGWHHPKRAKKRIGKKNSKHMKRLWQDPNYIAMQMRARGVRPNKTEKFLTKLFQKLYPNQWKYVGDGQFILAGKCPDFVNVNGQKKIIELFGEHVHKPEEEQERTILFSRYGYQTLVIWFKELNNMERLIERVTNFSEAI